MLRASWTSWLRVALAIAVCVAARPAQAAEGGGAPYPPGSAGPFSGGIPPFPGLFLLNQVNYFSLDRLVGPGGDKIPASFHGYGFAEVPRFLYVYPVTLPGGGVLATQAVPVITGVNLRAGNLQGSDSGLSDFIFSPVIMDWQVAPKMRAGFGFDMSFPIGTYRQNALVNLPPGYISFQPVLPFRYDNPNGLSVGLQPRLAFNTQNGVTHYQSGDSFIVDGSVGWNFGKWQPGIVGGWWHQFTSDKLYGSSLPFSGISGNRAQILNVGPSLLYSAGPLSFNLNYQHGFLARNTARSDSIWLNVALPLGAIASKLFR